MLESMFVMKFDSVIGWTFATTLVLVFDSKFASVFELVFPLMYEWMFGWMFAIALVPAFD